MGSFTEVTKWLDEAPFGTIAYYAGRGRSGQLFVYARNGRKAQELVEPDGGDNTVDGPALDWLMSQPAPRIMVTDRAFCGADDSLEQIQRLAAYERAGLVEVRDYAHG